MRVTQPIGDGLLLPNALISLAPRK